MQKTLARLFDVHPNTITNWEKEKKKGFLLFQKYFTKEDIEEFIETGEIKRINIMEEKKNQSSKEFELFKEFLKWRDEEINKRENNEQN